MKAPITLLLLAAALLLHSGTTAAGDAVEEHDSSTPTKPQPIQCFFCYEPTPVQDCNNIKTCPPDVPFCHTITQGSDTGYPFTSGYLRVTRDCSRHCVNSDTGALGSEREIFCCEGNLCNQRYEEWLNLISSESNSSAPGLHSATYRGVMVGVSVFSILFPAWL